MKPYFYISESRLQLIQTVMKIRIAKGFKAEDLSFLIGKAPFYISNAEYCNNTSYNESDLRLISAALKTPIPCLEETIPGQSLLKVSLERHLFESSYFHICTCYSDTNKEYVRYIFNEALYLKPELHIRQLQQYQKQLIAQKLQAMIREGYFNNAKWPYQVYYHLNDQLGLALSPGLLRELLNDCCLDDGIGGLEKRFENENCQYIVNTTQLRSVFLNLSKNKSY